MGAQGPSTHWRATPRERENPLRDHPITPLSQESASRPSAPFTQTKLQDPEKVLPEMPWVADYITDARLAPVLRSGLDGAPVTPPSSLPGFREERLVSPAFAPIDARVHTTPVRATKQAAPTIEQVAKLHSDDDGAQDSPGTSLPVIHYERKASPAVAPNDPQVHPTSVRTTEQAAPTIEKVPTLRSDNDGAQDRPATSLPVIHYEREASPAVAPIDPQVHPTSVRAPSQAARRTQEPPTSLPPPTGPVAPVTPPARKASSISSLSSTPNNTKSASPHRAVQKDFVLDEINLGFSNFSGIFLSFPFVPRSCFPLVRVVGL